MAQWKSIWDGMTQDSTIHELLERTRQCRGIALDVCGETMDYETFHKRSDAAAAWLQHQGYDRRSIVIVSMRASLDLFCMMAAVIKAGLVVTVTEDDIPEARLQKLRAQTNAVLRITDADAEGVFAAGSEMELTNITDTVSPDDVYAVWYTSGSTGEPCGIQTMARVIVSAIIPDTGNELLSGCLKECSAVINLSPPSFSVGFANFFYALFYGIRFVHIQTGLDSTIREIARKLRENRGCFLRVPPSVADACLRDADARAGLANCAALLMVSDMASPSLIRAVREVMGPEGKVINVYGSSEVGLVTGKITGPDDKPNTIGKPLTNAIIFVVDENRVPLPPGEVGELCVTGPRVGSGYIGAQGAKAGKFVRLADGRRIFFTGDCGRIGEDGEIYLLGRLDRMIKHLGFRVDATEIEEALRNRAHVRNAAVKQFDEDGKKTLCAFYESDKVWDPDELRRVIAEVLPRYCLPERFVRMEALPLTTRGKLDYHALVLERTDTGAMPYEAAQTEREAAICTAFEAVLGVRKAGRNDSFFALGGDSLSGMLLLALLGEKHGLHYRITDLFESPKPSQLAIRTENGMSAESPSCAQRRMDVPVDLPPEIGEIEKEEGVEAVYPLDHAGTLFAFLQETDSDFVRSALYFNLRVDLSCAVSEEEIRKRAQAVSDRHPALRSDSVKDHAGKRWQVFYKERAVPVWYRDIRSMGEAARERFFAGFFQAMDENRAAFQVGCFRTGPDACTVLVRLMHTQADGISYVIVLNELAGGIREDGQDAYYAYRQKQLRSRFSFPQELKDYYREFKGSCRLPLTPPKNAERTDERRILLTKQQTDRLRQLCGQKELTLSGYAEYCFGRGLLAVLQQKTVWLSHTYSGRDESLEGVDQTVGNLTVSLPVRICEGMSAREFQKELLIPWKYPYVSETAEYLQLERHNLEHGVISRIFPPFHKNIRSFRDYPFAFGQGLYLELREGQLVVVLRYPAGEQEKQNLDILEDTVSKLLLQGP